MPNGSDQSDDLEKQSNSTGLTVHGSDVSETDQPQVTIVVYEVEEAIANLTKDVDSPKKGHLSRSSNSHEEYRGRAGNLYILLHIDKKTRNSKGWPQSVLKDQLFTLKIPNQEPPMQKSPIILRLKKSMKKLLSKGYILVGHSLSNDLQALKIDHAWVIDTSFIFKYSGGPINRRPSLNNLCKVRKLGAPHNRLDEATAAMKLVLARIERQVNDSIPFNAKDVPEIEMTKFYFTGSQKTFCSSIMALLVVLLFSFYLGKEIKFQLVCKYSQSLQFLV